LPRLCGFPPAGCRRRQLSYRPHPLVELDLSSRVLPSNTYPAATTAESSHGLSLPSALEESEVHSPRASRPATFRLQGLATLMTACSLGSRAGFVSHRRRSWDSPFGGFLSRKVSSAFRPGKNPHTVGPAVFPPPKRQTGPTGLGFWVHASRDCLAVARRFKPTTTGASLGFCPSRVRQRRPCPGLLRRSSRVLESASRLLTGRRCTSEYRSVFALPRPTLARRRDRPRQPLWGSCTCPILDIRVRRCPGY
jgi:hypothetical protein